MHAINRALRVSEPAITVRQAKYIAGVQKLSHDLFEALRSLRVAVVDGLAQAEDAPAEIFGLSEREEYRIGGEAVAGLHADSGKVEKGR